DGGSHVSRSGTGWRPTPFTDSSGGRMVMEYAVQPGDPARVIMTSRGIALSTDAGRTWRLVLRSQVMFGPVAYAPSASSLAYAVGFDGSLWRSDDGGTSWTKVAGASPTAAAGRRACAGGSRCSGLPPPPWRRRRRAPPTRRSTSTTRRRPARSG